MPLGQERPLEWLGSSKKDLLSLPEDVRRSFGHALHFAQHGAKHDAAKPLKGFGDAGVLEVVANGEGGTFRAVYTVRYEEIVFVLHCFQKKSRSGSSLPKNDKAIIETRLKAASARIEEIRHGKASR